MPSIRRREPVILCPYVAPAERERCEPSTADAKLI
jgi:hypothetical protein